MGLFSSVTDFLGGGGSQDNKTTVSNSPWQPQQQYLTDLFGRAQTQSQPINAPRYYPSSTIAPFNANQIQGQNMTLAAAKNIQPTLSNISAGQNFLTSPNLLSPDTNPYLAATAQAAIQPLTDAYNQTIMPGIRQDAIVAGNLGNDRQGVAEGLASKALLNAAGNVSTDIYNNAYNTGLSNMNQALALSPSLLEAQFYPGQAAANVGNTQQAQAQAQLSDLVNRWNYEQGQPWQQLSNYAGLIGGSYGNTGTTNYTGQATQNPLTTLLQTGLGAYGLYNMFGGGGVATPMSSASLIPQSTNGSAALLPALQGIFGGGTS